MTPISVLFGPQGNLQTTRPNELRTLIHSEPELQFIVEALTSLPHVWTKLQDSCSALYRTHGQQRLKQLEAFILGQDDDADTLDYRNGYSNNIIISPLTIAQQYVDFWKLTHNDQLASPNERRIESVQGLCLGFLTAICISASRNETQLQTFISTAIRVALILGACVDLDSELREISACSIAVRWKSDTQYSDLLYAMQVYPGSYLSTHSGRQTATITAAETASLSLMEHLHARGIFSMLLPPQGRWHSPEHRDFVEAMIPLCSEHECFQLPRVNALGCQLHSNIDGTIITVGSLSETVLRSILLETSRWDLLFSELVKRGHDLSSFSMIGEKVVLPRSDPAVQYHDSNDLPEGAIAVIGLSCRYPEADDVEAFWELIDTGKCVIRELPKERFDPSHLEREPRGPFYGGYVTGSDMFDHQFFGISGREANSMDPQQRMSLLTAYEAMESAGYLGQRSGQFENDIGCFIGVANDDYDCNIASHPINAFSLSGSLRSFIAGRISHFFGWTGPSLTTDTACSAAAVAIHTACRALQAGDCSVALAGGVCAMTSSRMTQNLIGAGFLSPTGASKAFDASADGYCRAEGAGMVVLRAYKDALQRGDHILGIITGSAVNQGDNRSAIIVPDALSQQALQRQVLAESRTCPLEITYIEAHGTGTQVGDPIEFKSIRQTFGRLTRPDDVYVGSVKDNIGHTEASSGAASLIKTLLMLQKKTIPKLANFSTLNPKIAPLGPDHVVIPTQSTPWLATRRRKALINNYGASGSNAAFILEENRSACSPRLPLFTTYPLFITGKTSEAVQAYCRRLRSFVSQRAEVDLASIAYNLSIKQNRRLGYFREFTATGNAELISQLDSISDSQVQSRNVHHAPAMVILCFGGQDGKLAHIAKQLYDGSRLLQQHIGACEEVCTGLLDRPSVIMPVIFEPGAIEDLVDLHCTLFSIQYSCAMSWLDSGLKPDRLIGHSFGQLTALCVAGALSLVDALKLIIARAQLLWARCRPPRNGVMLAIEGGQLFDLEDLIARVPGCTAEVVCYNGPRSYVVAGDHETIAAIENAAKEISHIKPFRLKVLQNSHAFHSSMLDPMCNEYAAAAQQMEFLDPRIPIEACVSDNSRPSNDWTIKISAQQIVKHTREPVFFMDAVGRIEQQAGERDIIWLEAGSGSPIIPMIKRAAHNTTNRQCYVGTSLRNNTSAEYNLTNATLKLWSSKIKVQFWPFHDTQRDMYQWINVPPYQFAQVRHWLEYKPETSSMRQPSSVAEPYISEELLQNISSQAGLFKINTKHEIYRLATAGHKVVDLSLCPASMYCELVMTAAQISLEADTVFVPRLSQLAMLAPLVLDPPGRVYLKLDIMDNQAWNFEIYSNANTQSKWTRTSATLTHASGQIATVAQETIGSSISTLQSVQSIIYSRCAQIEASTDSVGYRGSVTYKAFRPVVTYIDYYQGIKSIYNLGKEAAVKVGMPHARPKNMGQGVCDHVLVDSFTQVSGVLANVFALREEEEEMWVCNFIGNIDMTQEFIDYARADGHMWTAYGKYDIPSPKRLTCDIFVFEPITENIVLTIRSIEFAKVSIKSLTKVLSKLNHGQSAKELHPVRIEPTNEDLILSAVDQHIEEVDQERRSRALMLSTTHDDPSDGADLLIQVKSMLKDILEIPIDQIQNSSHLENLGFDSLLATELFSEVKKRFAVRLSHTEFASISDVQGLTTLVMKTVASAAPCGENSKTAVLRTESVSSWSVVSTGSAHKTQSSQSSQSSQSLNQQSATMESLVYGEKDGLELLADVYYPPLPCTDQSLPVALMIHGGGHVMYTRKDIREEQTQTLLKLGFLPISIDYRLAPEVPLEQGAMQDVCDALQWVQQVLPSLTLARSDITVNGNKVVAIGWSSGVQLAMSLGWTAPARGIRPPEAVYAFYGPTNYEDPFWSTPNMPFDEPAIPPPTDTYEHLRAGLNKTAIAGYSPDPSKRALGGWMSLEDPRSRIVLHMNWEGMALPFLIYGLTVDGIYKKLPMPSTKEVQRISPLAHIQAGRYRVPTYLIHGTRDDLVPWQQSQMTYEALQLQGVHAKIAVLDGALHLFDMYSTFKHNPMAMQAVQDGFEFLKSHV